MSQNQEFIEAKLCAFIDGELDAEGRVEIEKHLEANPQHRRLLESLKATRDLLKWLPRETAPPEVSETLNGQLERSVLLDAHEDSPRLSIGPRMLAAAAIIALTAGLGLAVYYTLPKSQKNATPFTFRGDGAANYGQDVPENEKADRPAPRREVAHAGTVSKASAGSAGESGNNAASKAEAGELERWAREVGDNRDAIAAVANGTPSPALAVKAAPIASNAVVMLVRSNAPQDTRRQVTTFLDAQNIRWKEAPVVAPAQLNQQARQTIATPPRLLQSQQSQSPQSQSPQSQSQQSQSPNLRQSESQTANARQTQQAEALTTMPATLAANGGHDLQDQNIGALNNAATQPAGDSFAAALAMMKPGAADRGMYVARMSRQQAVSLGNTIALEPAQSTELKDFAGVTMTLDELGSGKSASAANSVVRNNIPGPMPPATQSASPISPSGLAGGGLVGGLAGAGGGETNAPAAQPTDTQPVTQALRRDVLAAADRRAGAATQAVATGATQPSEDALDVVIVVEEGAGPSTTAPASQPVPEPATQPADGATSQPARAQ